jgi:hypothetical protein
MYVPMYVYRAWSVVGLEVFSWDQGKGNCKKCISTKNGVGR